MERPDQPLRKANLEVKSHERNLLNKQLKEHRTTEEHPPHTKKTVWGLASLPRLLSKCTDHNKLPSTGPVRAQQGSNPVNKHFPPQSRAVCCCVQRKPVSLVQPHNTITPGDPHQCVGTQLCRWVSSPAVRAPPTAVATAAHVSDAALLQITSTSWLPPKSPAAVTMSTSLLAQPAPQRT